MAILKRDNHSEAPQNCIQGHVVPAENYTIILRSSSCIYRDLGECITMWCEGIMHYQSIGDELQYILSQKMHLRLSPLCSGLG